MVNIILRFTAWILMSFIYIPIGVVVHKFLPKYRTSLAIIYNKLLVRILGIKVEVIGEQENDGAVFFAPNHQSYLDIPVLGSVVRGRFVSKSEVRKWPLIGYLAELQNAIFIKRERTKAGEQTNHLTERVHDGDSIIAFPEGTTGDGHKVLSFKSSLFSIASEKLNYKDKKRYLKVQPISVHFSELNGQPVSYDDMQYYTWIGDEALIPHLPRFFDLGKKTVTVEFHPVISMDEFKNRKEMAKYCEDVVGSTF